MFFTQGGFAWAIDWGEATKSLVHYTRFDVVTPHTTKSSSGRIPPALTVSCVVRELFDPRKAVASARVLEGYLTRMLTATCFDLDLVLEVKFRGSDVALPVNQVKVAVSVIAELIVIVVLALVPV